jgi:hypothetical protein
MKGEDGGRNIGRIRTEKKRVDNKRYIIVETYHCDWNCPYEMNYMNAGCKNIRPRKKEVAPPPFPQGTKHGN